MMEEEMKNVWQNLHFSIYICTRPHLQMSMSEVVYLKYWWTHESTYFQTPSQSLPTSCRPKADWNLSHRCYCWPGNSPTTLFLLSPMHCCNSQLSHSKVCWDRRLCIVWTAGGNVVCFLFINNFHMQQQLEAKSQRFRVRTRCGGGVSGSAALWQTQNA